MTGKIMFWNGSRHANEADLNAYADEALRESARDGVESHLAACERCRSELGVLRELKASLAAMPRVRAPHAFALRPADVQDAPAQTQPRGTPLLLAGVAMIALVTFVTLVAVDVGGTPNDSSGADGVTTVAESADQSFDDGAAQPDAAGGESAVGDTADGAPPAPTDEAQARDAAVTENDEDSDISLRAAEAGTAALAIVAGGALVYVWRRRERVA